MKTKRLSIRRFQSDDLENVFALLSDAEVMKFLEAPYTKEKTQMFLQKYALSDQPLIYAVEDHGGVFVGYIIYHPYEEDSYEIGWVLHKSQWGKGYASELTQCLIENARGKVGRLIIECSPQQTATKQIARKHHFVLSESRDGLDIYQLPIA